MDQRPDLFSRFVTGPVLIAAGLAIYAGLLVLHLMQPPDLFIAVGIALGAEAYAIVAGLFVLLGLRYSMGPRRWAEAWIGKSLSHLVIVAAVTGGVIVAALLFAFW